MYYIVMMPIILNAKNQGIYVISLFYDTHNIKHSADALVDFCTPSSLSYLIAYLGPKKRRMIQEETGTHTRKVMHADLHSNVSIRC